MTPTQKTISLLTLVLDHCGKTDKPLTVDLQERIKKHRDSLVDAEKPEPIDPFSPDMRRWADGFEPIKAVHPIPNVFDLHNYSHLNKDAIS